MLAVVIFATSLQAANLGVASSPQPFQLAYVEAKPEAGPVPLVENDRIVALHSAVAIRAGGRNRAALGIGSLTEVRALGETGQFFHLRSGSIAFDALQDPMAICAANKLYVPRVPASGRIVIGVDGTVQATGLFLRRAG